MKEVKFMLLAAMCMAMFSLTSCSDDDDFKPEDALQTALMAKYPNATRVEWEKKKTYLVADCDVDGKDLEVWFTADAQWKMTETELRAADLPTAITAALAAHPTYGTWRVDDRDLLEYADGTSIYVIEVEEHNKEVDLYFSANGKLLNEVDVTTGDDTHWPEDSDYSKPGAAVQAALKAKYPNATRVEWEKKKTYLVADCDVDGRDLEVWFTADAQWKMTETELRATDLPAAITAALAAHPTYKTWRVDDRDLLEYADGTSMYVIEVEEHNKEFDLYFSANGKLLNEVDVTTGDDTHWPEDSDYSKPGAAVQAALKAKYPNATRVEWEKKKTYLVADCDVDGRDLEVWFTADAQWKMTETELRATDLPAAITAALAAHPTYKTWRVDDRDLLEYADGTSMYVIEVEEHNKEFDLYFSANGELLKEIDVTTGDDTHWPE